MCGWAGGGGGGEVGILRPGFAVIGGIALLAPFLPGVLISSRDAVQHNAVSWIQIQPPAWPYTVFRDVAGKTRLFELLEALIVFGFFSQVRSGRLAWGFLAAWMLRAGVAGDVRSRVTPASGV